MSTKVKTDTSKNHRAVVTRHSGLDVLQMIEEELSEPQAGEVRVKVLAVGVSAYNLMFRSSGSLPGTPRVPFTLGTDVVGVVDKLGEGVTTASQDRPLSARLSTFNKGRQGRSKWAQLVWCSDSPSWRLDVICDL